MAYLAALETDLQHRIAEIRELRESLKRVSLDEISFEGNDKKLLYYTGIPTVAIFRLILRYLDAALTSNVRCKKVTNFQKLVLCLMKLRHNTSFRGLGYRFGISNCQAGRIFKKVVLLIEHTFRYFVHWPDRESLHTLMPPCFFRKFGKKVAVIMDCFEIQIQRPSTLKARVQTFLNYKHRNTIKYLIGITPHGHISFISEGYGGRKSDRAFTEECGILNNLIPGDLVLADRGFTIYDLVSAHMATVNIPAFTKGKSQLHPREVEKTRDIANVRIHVERVIGLTHNKFNILNGPISVSLLNTTYKNKNLVDYIVCTCCILCNMVASIVPI